MAKKLQTPEEWEKYDQVRMELAIREIEKSPNLRFFFRSQLTVTGVQSTPIGETPDQTSYLCGRHSVGTDLITTLLTFNPSLYPALLEEDINEQRERNNADEDY